MTNRPAVFLSSLFFFTTLFLDLDCKHATEPGDGHDSHDSVRVYTKPIANAGPDQTTRIGSYIILDATASTSGGGETLLYKWTQAPSNPYQVFVMDDWTQPMGFFQEGTYTFYLVVDNQHYKSDPDTVRIAVTSRVPCVIQDTSLEMSIRYALGLKTEELNDENLSKLDTLRLYYIERTTTLSGIEHCRSLTMLLLGFQHITDVSPLSGLTKLQFLDITQCRMLVDIGPLETLTNLTHFDISGNKVRDISCVANMVNLKYLNISWNLIEDISALQGLHELQTVYLGSNKVVNIKPLVDNPGLGAGDMVALPGNPLDSVSVNVYIPALLSRGVLVSWY